MRAPYVSWERNFCKQPYEGCCFLSQATAWDALAAAVKIALGSSFSNCSQLAMYWA